MSLEQLLKDQLGAEADISGILSAAESEAKALADSQVNGLVSTKEKLLNEVKALKKNQLPDGVDLDAYNNFLTEKEQLESDRAKADEEAKAAAGKWDELKNDMTSTFANEKTELVTTYESQIKDLKDALDSHLVENVAIKAIDKEQGNATLLLPHIKPDIKTIRNEQGKYETIVVDSAGEPRLNPKTADPFTVADLVAEFKANETFAGAFPMQNDGGDTYVGPQGKVVNGMNPWKADTRNVTQQAKITKENPTLAAQLRKAAGLK